MDGETVEITFNIAWEYDTNTETTLEAQFNLIRYCTGGSGLEEELFIDNTAKIVAASGDQPKGQASFVWKGTQSLSSSTDACYYEINVVKDNDTSAFMIIGVTQFFYSYQTFSSDYLTEDAMPTAPAPEMAFMEF